MSDREKEPDEAERRRKERDRVGGGPYAPGGDTEPSNIPGESRERGMRPPEPGPVAPEEPGEIEE